MGPHRSGGPPRGAVCFCSKGEKIAPRTRKRGSFDPPYRTPFPPFQVKIDLRSKLPVCLGAAALIATLAPASSAQLEGYDLVSGVPSDYFLVVGSSDVPEAAFIDEHWANVWDAFRETEILEDLMDMVSAEDPEATQLMMEMFEQYRGLAANVDWDAMGGQFLFAERLNVPVFADNEPEIGMPDMIFLMRMDPEVAEKNHAALVGMGQRVLDDIGMMSGGEVELSFQAIEEHGFAFSVLDFTQFEQDAVDIPISIGHKDGVLAITIGPGVRSEVAALMAGQGDIRSIASTERFKRAFKDMPKAEMGFEYFDMPNMRGSMEDIFEMVSSILESEIGPPPSGDEEGMLTEEQMIAGMIEHGMGLAYDAMSLIEYSSSVSYVRGTSVHTIGRAAVAPGIESNPFYPLIGSTESVVDFAKYLPETTTSYTVAGAMDANGIYDFMLDMVAGFGPMGEQALSQWGFIQEEMGFDMRRDVLSWVGGESISVSFLDGGDEHWVTRMAVAEEDVAREKLNMVADMVPMIMAEAVKENPMAGMLGLMVRDSRDERFVGFKRIDVAMLDVSMLMGVKDGWMMFGSSADALALTDAVAAGTAPSVRENKELMSRAIIPDGPVQAASFSDYTGIAEELAGGLMMVGSMGGMMTMSMRPDEREIAGEMISMVTRLAPVIGEMDFFDSGSSTASFDGKAWHTHSVTNYRPVRKPAPVSGD